MPDLQKFQIPHRVKFQKSKSGLDRIIVTNDFAEAVIYLHGGNLTHFRPKGEKAVIFGGRGCEMYPDKTLHAGIPICWPWFGPHPEDDRKPQHGFARNRRWELKKTAQLDGGETEIVLGLQEDEGTLALFGHPFELRLHFTVGKSLRIELETRNTGEIPFSFTEALHSYFYLSDIDNAVIYGVEDTPYTDLADGGRKKREAGALRIDRVINRVYEPTESRCRIIDSGFGRVITVDKRGSNATTIWNPGAESGLHDLPGDLYRTFVCVESCNAGEDIITLKAGASHRILQEISVSDISEK